MGSSHIKHGPESEKKTILDERNQDFQGSGEIILKFNPRLKKVTYNFARNIHKYLFRLQKWCDN